MSVEWEVPPQQPEGIRWRRISGAIGGTIALFAISVGIEWAMGAVLANGRNPARQQIPAAVSQRTINLLEQVPVQIAMHGYELREDQLRRLDGYGWVDPERGIVHVPVEVEMERMVRAAEAGEGGSAPDAKRGGGGR